MIIPTKDENILNPNTCWNRAEPDEPIFVLRANDPAAPVTVVMWAARYLIDKGGMRNMTPAQIEKYHDAMGLAKLMRDWRIKKQGLDDDIPY